MLIFIDYWPEGTNDLKKKMTDIKCLVFLHMSLFRFVELYQGTEMVLEML